jgi:hypothetical protein
MIKTILGGVEAVLVSQEKKTNVRNIIESAFFITIKIYEFKDKKYTYI